MDRQALRRAQSNRWEILGVLGVLLVFAGSTGKWALDQPPFIGVDEVAHLGYAHAISRGDVPEIRDPPSIPAHATVWQAKYDNMAVADQRTIWVAVHPPLFYVLTAPLAALARSTERADGGLLWLRGANMAFATLGVLFTYRLAREVTRSHVLALAAMALVALLPLGHEQLALGMNDGLGFASATALTWAAVRLVTREQPTLGDRLALAASATAAAGARTVTLGITIAVVLVVAGLRLSGGRTRRDRWRAAGRLVVIGLGPAMLLFGWFYVRSTVLYGNPAASAYVADYQGLRARPITSLFDAGLWLDSYHGLLRPVLAVFLGSIPRAVTITADAVAAVGVVGLVLLVVRRGRADDRTPAVGLRGVLVLSAVVLAMVASVAAFFLQGGPPFSRYALAAGGSLATLLVVGLDRVAPKVGPALVVVLLAARAWPFVFLRVRVPPGPLPIELRSAISGAAAADACVAAAGLGALLVVASLAVRRLPRALVR